MNLTIETKRLLLREMRLSDAAAFIPNGCHKMFYIWNKPLTTLQKLYTPCSRTIQKNKIGRFVVILKETNELIGWAGLKYNTEIVNNKVDF
jgi:RimJ/RimL family protein N-acetyltransferase